MHCPNSNSIVTRIVTLVALLTWRFERRRSCRRTQHRQALFKAILIEKNGMPVASSPGGLSAAVAVIGCDIGRHWNEPAAHMDDVQRSISAGAKDALAGRKRDVKRGAMPAQISSSRNSASYSGWPPTWMMYSAASVQVPKTRWLAGSAMSSGGQCLRSRSSRDSGMISGNHECMCDAVEVGSTWLLVVLKPLAQRFKVSTSLPVYFLQSAVVHSETVFVASCCSCLVAAAAAAKLVDHKHHQVPAAAPLAA
jgi:hypothetical protein